ncbi:MBL fold metallo-hydrolase [Arthrobacter sp. Soil763]|uniref:MBL fold metallo-hydrolase n=1 Tax=Arthrobacter sp. Soil763 TaxID=1736402 RepID=UPI0006FC157F|nr:MBL fold metallo-hydrolase [Arthrobacter sp. Soil763]KRE79361.1 MBL fold metallo-hydrolase [Arthrobacter sp. Soil763]
MDGAALDFTTGVPRAGNLDVAWIHGSESAKHNTDPDIQVHAYDEHTVILRQNMAVNYEAPFMFLLFGNSRAVLIDTGATFSASFFPLRSVVDGLVEAWLAAHPRKDYGLMVLHTHPHGDHVAGDAQFADRPDTVVVDAGRGSAWEFFGFADDGDDSFGDDDGDARQARVDLGGRVLQCWPSPGHHDEAVTFYDPYTGLLFTGDTVYPGRLYINDWPAFVRTIDRLIGFCARHPVRHILGCHIEMTRAPGVDYPIYTTYQPDEPPLQLAPEHLAELRRAIDVVDGRPGRHAFDRFVLSLDAG